MNTKNAIKKKTTYGTLILAGILTLAFGKHVSFADAIIGDIGFGMAATLEDASGTQVTDATLATQIDFFNSSINAIITLTTGSYDPIIPMFSGATFTDFAFLPDPGTVPVTPLWTTTTGTNTASFDLLAVEVDPATHQGLLALTGTGILRLTGFDDTDVMWTLSADAAGSNFAFSSTATSPVPEPSAYVLIAAGIGGLAIAHRRRKTRL